jgi:L-fucose isomerase
MAKIALITIADGREDFLEIRKPLIVEELEALNWLREKFDIVESGIITNEKDIKKFAELALEEQVECLLIHIPIWADPIFSIKIQNYLKIPILILGNDKPETSSIVGILGAGGALNQIGCEHVRVFNHREKKGNETIIAFVKAVSAINMLKGQVLGMFGSRSLGIFTTVSDPAQVQKLFDVDIKCFDQLELVEKAKALDTEKVKSYKEWFIKNIRELKYGGLFNEDSLDRQIRSYIATEEFITQNELDFVCVKCQQELSDGYTSQCVSHMLSNGTTGINGKKKAMVHACESDIDGALTMKILSVLSGGKAAALLDIRKFDKANKLWTFANCGAVAADFFFSNEDESGLASVSVVPHVFGKAGGCALSSILSSQTVTMARLCRKNGEYWMAILKGEVQTPKNGELDDVTSVFPKGLIKTSAGDDFLEVFDSNHLHIVAGEYIQELKYFCALKKIQCKIWE